MATIVLEGPAKNALSTELLLRLKASLAAAPGEPLLLTGAGDTFSAGLQLKELASLNETQMAEFLVLLEGIFTTLYQWPAPVVGLINGHAIAGGCVLALCCDHRVAPRGSPAKIGLNEVAIGVRYPPRTLELVRRRVPVSSQDEVILGGGLFGVDRALQLGLIDAVSDDAPAAAKAKLDALSALPRDIYAATKQVLRGSTPQDLVSDADQSKVIASAIGSWTSPALKARIEKLLGKK